MKRVAIIGGGAAGMMTAAQLVEQGFGGEVVLFECNKGLGAKVIISGGGRCNVTTGITDVRMLVREKYPRGGQFLSSALKAFGPAKIRAWFEVHNVPLKEERDKRVFPVSDDGKDIVRVFERMCREHKNLRVRYGVSVKDVAKASGGFDVSFMIGPDSKVQTERFDYVVLTTGGSAYAHTGSQGDGYAFARGLGHTITPLGPSLNSFLTQEVWTKELSGTSFAHAEISAMRHDGMRAAAVGPVLLTHFGFSGPAAFAFAAHVAHETIDAQNPLTVRLRIDADRDRAAWDEVLRSACEADGRAPIVRVLKEFMTTRFAVALGAQIGVDAEQKKCAELSKVERGALAEMLGDGIALTVTARRPGDEFVTAGGVTLDEVDAKTGQSRLVPGLYFAGEVLDVDGVTGGFNLSASWAMGYLVGRSIARDFTE